MRLLVCPHQMSMGGSQLIAVDLAARAVRAGHEVLLAAPDGPLVDRVAALGLDHVRTPVAGSAPSWPRAAALTRLVRERRIDLVHAYEWGPALDLAYGPHLRLGTPVLTTVLSMDVPSFLPRHVPLVLGTAELAAQAAERYSDVSVLEPPIDTDENAPGPDRAVARARFGLAEDDVVLAVVCRMTEELGKAAGVREAIDAVAELGTGRPLRLLLVGDGPELADLRDAAQAVNRRTGRETVVVTGQLLDPRPAYDAADVVLGMGSSALRGLAFARPLVVQGDSGFWRLLTPETEALFLTQGFWGHGTGDGVTALLAELAPVLDDPAARERLGRAGRALVTERFSLDATAARYEELYQRAAAWRPGSLPGRARLLAGSALELAKYKVAMRAPELRTAWRTVARRPVEVTR